MIKRVVIVEDETAAAVNFRSMLKTIVPDVEVLTVLESVEEAVEYFSEEVEADRGVYGYTPCRWRLLPYIQERRHCHPYYLYHGIR